MRYKVGQPVPSSIIEYEPWGKDLSTQDESWDFRKWVMTKGNDNKSKKQLNDQILGIVFGRFYNGPIFTSIYFMEKIFASI